MEAVDQTVIPYQVNEEPWRLVIEEQGNAILLRDYGPGQLGTINHVRLALHPSVLKQVIAALQRIQQQRINVQAAAKRQSGKPDAAQTIEALRARVKKLEERLDGQ